MRNHRLLVLACALVAAVLGAPAAQAATPSEKLSQKVSVGAIVQHLEALQQIADENGGNRASITPGYTASVDYVVGQAPGGRLRRDRPALQVLCSSARRRPRCSSASRPPAPVRRTGRVRHHGLLGQRQRDRADPARRRGRADRRPPRRRARPRAAARCPTSAGLPGGESRSYSAARARSASRRRTPRRREQAPSWSSTRASRTGGRRCWARSTRPRPSSIARPRGELRGRRRARRDVAGRTRTCHIFTQTVAEDRTSSNVLAETRCGDPNNVDMTGAHLDSVFAGPGINDNGTGSATSSRSRSSSRRSST